jgi:hypothetical protein
MKSEELSTISLGSYFKHLQEVTAEFKLNAHPAVVQCRMIAAEAANWTALKLESQVAAQRLVEEVITASRPLQETLRPMILEQERWASLLQPIRQATKFDAGKLSQQFAQIDQLFRQLPPRTREALLLLGEHGWYLDPEMSLPDLWEFKEVLVSGNVKQSELALADYFEARADGIEKSLTERLPHRAHLLRSAFNAHRRGEYELSIPVLLAQTDGICKELVDHYLFIKRNKKPETAVYVERFAADTYRAAILSPLAQTLPIGASESERRAGRDALNRHTVLHGESLDYGNKINGLKAISLINYVAHVLGAEKIASAADANSTRPSEPSS